MRPTLKSLLPLLLLSATTHAAVESIPAQNAPHVTLNFDQNWLFHKADDPAAKDRPVSLPHDWSIEGPYSQSAPTQRGGNLPAGVGLYTKEFSLPPSFSSKRTSIDFDGIMANSEVFLNGHSLGKRAYGYSSLHYDLTPFLLFDKTNTLTVRVDDTPQPASRWYTGAGINRHVRLQITEPLHIQHWSTFISTPEVKGEQATVHVKTTLQNESDAPQSAALEIQISDGPNLVKKITLPAQTIAPGKTLDLQQDLPIDRPLLWDINNPHLYSATLNVTSNNALIDTETTPFGIRLTEWKPATGFWLNGNNLKILGACIHSDAGAVGSAVPLSIYERRLALLKTLGVNAIRTAHNPPNPEFLTLCDRMGFLVMEEPFDTWTTPKPNAEQGYNRLFAANFQADIRDMVLRDRNHPSIIIYSAGNEIRDNLTNQAGKDRFIAQRDIYHQLDPTRPVTQALFRPSATGEYAPGGIADLMDVLGTNYHESELAGAARQNPKRVLIGTENLHDVATWRTLRDNPAMSGQFLWAAFDYLGESDWPSISRYNGLFDRTGEPHARALQRQSWWSDKPMVAVVRNNPSAPPAPTAADAEGLRLLADWTPAEGAAYTQANLQVYTNCQSVELFLNDKSLGTKPRNANDAPITFSTPFQPGTLKAIAKNDGKQVATFTLQTAGTPAKISALSDRPTLTPSFDDVAIVHITLQDAQGIMNPTATNLMTFKLEGPAQLVALDNGDKTSHEPYQNTTQRSLFQGHAIAIIRATAPGKITLTTSTPNLPDTTTPLTAQ